MLAAAAGRRFAIPFDGPIMLQHTVEVADAFIRTAREGIDGAHVCDLCGGAPRCVEECPMEAISYLPEKSGTIRLAALRKAHKGLTPEAKRLEYALHITVALRAAWAARRSA